MTLVPPPRPQSGPGDCGPHLGLTWPWLLLFPHEPHLDLVAVVFLYTHIYLVTPVPLGPHVDLVTLTCQLASPGPAELGGHVGLTHTW